MFVRIVGTTHVGLKREHNEDAYGAFPDAGLACVADGLGGHASGEVASRIAVSVMEEVANTILSGDPEGGLQRFHEATCEAHHRCIRYVLESAPESRGMGTTLTALLLRPGGEACVIHIGDSRLYRYQGGVLTPMTDDHSVVYRQVIQGTLSREEARLHPRSNVITRCIMGEPAAPADKGDFYSFPAQVGDRFLLCSDGLSDLLSEAELQVHFQEHGDPGALLQRLVERALQEGGRDNITALLVDVLDEEA